MQTYDPQKPLISIHIPKCAGSSFSNILVSWFGKGFLQHYHNEKQNRHPIKHMIHTDLLKKQLKPGLCIHGHFNNARGNGVHDYYPEIDQFITIMRNPFNLHLSNYFYVKQLAQNGNAYRSGKQPEIIEKGWNLEDYLREVNKSYLCYFLPSNITLDNYKQLLEEQFLFIGITENLQESVNILSHKLNLPIMEVPESNVSEWNESIPDSAMEEFIDNNSLEMAIYNHVKNSLVKHLSEHNAQL